MDLQVVLKPPCRGPFYRPGEDVEGWVQCHSSCLRKSTDSAMKSIHVSLVGECHTFVTDEYKSKLFNQEEIMKQSILLYSAEDPKDQKVNNIVGELEMLAFILVIAHNTSTGLNASVGEKVVSSLPSSFEDEHDPEHRYIRYWVAASGIRANGGGPIINRTVVRVISWDPELRKPKLELPRLLSSSPYILQAPKDKWRVLLHWTPLQFTTYHRSDFYGKPMPNNCEPAKEQTICSECHALIQGPRFVCCDCQTTVNWCWGCICNSNKAHIDGHVFVRIDKSRNKKDCIQKNLAAKALVMRLRQKRKTSRKGNRIIQIIAESIHTFWLPNIICYPQGVDIPVLMTVKISSNSQAALPGLRPMLPWDEFENTSGRTNNKRPSLWLSVSLNSTVNGLKESTPWRQRSMWLDNGWWLSPESPDDSSVGPKRSFSCDWSAPTMSDAGQWVQTAAVCSSIKRVHLYDRHFDEPPIRLGNLQTQFKLYFTQKIAGVNVEIRLSDIPWTSGVFKTTGSDTDSLSSIKPLPSLPI